MSMLCQVHLAYYKSVAIGSENAKASLTRPVWMMRNVSLSCERKRDVTRKWIQLKENLKDR
jgi:hypothetical protein